MRIYFALAAVALLTSACGDKDDNQTEKGLAIPTSVVSDAELAPGTIIAFDAEKLKSEMESGGRGNYRANTEDTDPASCTGKLFNEILVEAKDDTFLVASTIDFSACFPDAYKNSDSFAGADFSELKAEVKTQIVSWLKCPGSDLSKYNGKKISEISTVVECEKVTEFSSYSENRTTTVVSGKIKNVASGTEKKDYTIEQESLTVYAERVAAGKPCSGKIVSGVKVWNDDCIITDRNIDTKNKSGFSGSEEEDADVGKASYEKLAFVGLKEVVDETSPWFSGGQFNVTFQDWTGTVKFSSPTAEPIFEMTKGSETVTGTVKKYEDSTDTFSLKRFSAATLLKN